MRLRCIRWRRDAVVAQPEARRACAAWLRSQGYAVTVLFGELWLVSARGWSHG